MVAIFRSHVAFPESIYVESFTMEDGAVLLIEDTQGHAQAPHHFRLGDYRPMNDEACDLFDAACAARALVADGRNTTHDFITDSISSRLNGFIGGKITNSTLQQMRAMVEASLSNDVLDKRISDFSVAVTAAGEIEVKATLTPTIRQAGLDPRYQMIFEVK